MYQARELKSLTWECGQEGLTWLRARNSGADSSLYCAEPRTSASVSYCAEPRTSASVSYCAEPRTRASVRRGLRAYA
eukprot:1361815-Rhodomonas_salina.1